MNRLLAALIILFLGTGPAFALEGVRKKRPRPYEYGSVVIDNYSTRAGVVPVTFDHWPHRARYSCRLCHVDLGFAMQAGGTEVTAADNRQGYFCGACHDGKRTWDGKAIFTACAEQPAPQDRQVCQRCHSVGRNPAREKAFADFATALPKERFGNGIDWEKAEQTGQIKPLRYLEGVSIRRPELATQEDFSIEAKVAGMPEIVFSHRKHTAWNGCELCHPDIFVGIKKGATRYTMIDLFAGKYCGACHDKVAFPQTDCQRCHTKPVQ